MPRKNQSKSGRIATVQETADELDLSVELVRDYAMRGCPHDKNAKGRSNLFDPDEVAAWMRENGLTGDPGRPAKDSSDLEAAKLREINLRCRKHELDVAEREGRLVSTDDVKSFVSELLTVFKNNWVGFAAATVPHLQGRDPAEQQSILETRAEELFASLATALVKRFGGAGMAEAPSSE